MPGVDVGRTRGWGRRAGGCLGAAGGGGGRVCAAAGPLVVLVAGLLVQAFAGRVTVERVARGGFGARRGVGVTN